MQTYAAFLFDLSKIDRDLAIATASSGVNLERWTPGLLEQRRAGTLDELVSIILRWGSSYLDQLKEDIFIVLRRKCGKEVKIRFVPHDHLVEHFPPVGAL